MEVEVRLKIVEFYPWSGRFIPQAEIEGQGWSNTPIVLTVSAESPCKLMPRVTVADADAPGYRIAGKEVRCRITGERTTEQDVTIRGSAIDEIFKTIDGRTRGLPAGQEEET